MPNTSDGIHLGVAFGYPGYEERPAKADYIWGAPSPATPAYAEGYIPFDVDWQLAQPGAHDLAWFQRNHPSWIVYRCDRRTPAYYDGHRSHVPLDFTNPEVRRYQIARAVSLLRAGYRGIDIDNFTLTNYQHRCGAYRRGKWHSLGYSPQRRAGDERVIHDMLVWLRDVSRALHHRFRRMTLTLNSNVFADGGETYARKLIPYIDGDFDEGSFTDWGQEWLSGDSWEEEVRWADDLASAHKALILDELVHPRRGGEITSSDLNWALANYLLVKSDHTFTYVYPNGRAYGRLFDEAQYHVAIGQPLTSHFNFDSVEARSFTGGVALVNPSSTQAYTVSLPSAYQDLNGQSVTQVTLPPVSGAVLVGPPFHTTWMKRRHGSRKAAGPSARLAGVVVREKN